jgi:SRSO17 transposase
VSVRAASDQASCPLQWRLFLPQEWAQDRDRCKAAGVPGRVGHTAKRSSRWRSWTSWHSGD